MVMVSNRDKRFSAWTVLLLVSVLSCPRSCRSSSCRGAEWSEDRIQDLESSWITSTNATLTLQAVQTSLDKDACAHLCCQNTSGNCTATGILLQSNNGGSNGTCYLYSCAPALPFCVFTSANGTDAVLTALPQDKSRRTSRIQASAPTDIVGDGTQSKGRKGVLPELQDDLLLKHDNTTVKPRKGVLKAHNVNGRKGVGKDALVLNSELFSEDVTSTNSSVENNSSQTTVLVLVEDLVNETQSALNSTTTTTITTTTTQSLKGFDSTLNISDLQSEDQGNVTNVTTPSTEVTEPHNTRTSPTVSSSTTSRLAVTEMAEVVARVQEMKDSTVTQDGDDANWEMNQSNTAMHLVIGLVLGLMVLLTVIGIVAKRVHDSWQRRHYHRMDFLIDGMYHGNA